jgi:hypothetical protein
MGVTFVCRYDEGDETYDLLRKTENVIPKIISLLHNTLSGRGGNGYKYGVFTLRIICWLYRCALRRDLIS